MVDLDDFDWRKVAGLIIFAVLVMAGGIFVINDYLSAKRMRSVLDDQLKALSEFEQTYKPPSRAQLEELKGRQGSLKKELEALSPRLETEVDTGKLETKIENQAVSNNVTLEKMEFQPSSKDGFLDIFPVYIIALGPNERLGKFISGLNNLGVPWRYSKSSPPKSSKGRIEMVIEFQAFDQEGWYQTYPCNLPAELPATTEVDVGKIKIFKDNLDDLKFQVDNAKSKMSEADQALKEKCDIERQISGLEKRIKLTQEASK